MLTRRYKRNIKNVEISSPSTWSRRDNENWCRNTNLGNNAMPQIFSNVYTIYVYINSYSCEATFYVKYDTALQVPKNDDKLITHTCRSVAFIFFPFLFLLHYVFVDLLTSKRYFHTSFDNLIQIDYNNDRWIKKTRSSNNKCNYYHLYCILMLSRRL